MAGRVPSRGSEQFVVRLPDGMREKIKAAAEAAGRSMNSEIVSRLDESLHREMVPGTDHILHIILDTNGMPTSWSEVVLLLNELTRHADLSTAKIEFNVITPGMVDLNLRVEEMLAKLERYRELQKSVASPGD